MNESLRARARAALFPEDEERRRVNAKAQAFLTNPFVKRDGSLANPYLDYQKIIDRPGTNPTLAAKITEATGITPTKAPAAPVQRSSLGLREGTAEMYKSSYDSAKTQPTAATETAPAAVSFGAAAVGGKATYNVGKFSASKSGADYVNRNSPFSGYTITSYTGSRNTGIKGASTYHAGIDRAVPEGTRISLPIATTFYRSGSDNARGNWIELKDAKGNIMHYQHLQSFAVGYRPGDTVSAGTVFAVSGSTGVGRPHLHEEYYTPDGSVNITESYWNSYAPLK